MLTIGGPPKEITGRAPPTSGYFFKEAFYQGQIIVKNSTFPYLHIRSCDILFPLSQKNKIEVVPLKKSTECRIAFSIKKDFLLSEIAQYY